MLQRCRVTLTGTFIAAAAAFAALPRREHTGCVEHLTLTAYAGDLWVACAPFAFGRLRLLLPRRSSFGGLACGQPRRPRLLQRSTCAPYAPGAQAVSITCCSVRRHASRATRHLRHRQRSAAVSIGTGRALLDPAACPSPVLRRHR